MTDIRIGHLSTAYHTAIVMIGSKSLEDVGIDPHWKLFGTGPSIIQGIKEGDLDIGYIGLPPAIIGIANGGAMKCVAGGHEEGTVFIARSKYKSAAEAGSICNALQQFKGKTIGSPARGSIHDVILRYFLSREGVDKYVDIINFPWTDFVGQAMEDGSIEAAVGTPSLQVSLEYISGVLIKSIVPPADLWPHNPSYGIIASTNFIEKQPDLLMAFLKAHKNAIGLIKEKPNEAAKISSEVMAVVDPGFFIECYKVSPRYCCALTEDYVNSTMRFVEILKEHGYINRNVIANEIFDTSLIEKIHPEPHHYDHSPHFANHNMDQSSSGAP